MVRITQSMQIARTLLDQNLNMERMNEYSNNMSSRTTLHRPSDDPIKVARAMRLITELKVNETYKYDLQSAESWTSKTDVSLNTLSDILKRIRELSVQAASGEKTDEDKRKIQSEIKELKESAIQIGNDDYMGRYQFSGHKTNTKFLTKDGKYNKELNLAGLKYEKISYNIGVGQKTDINITGVEVFGNENFTTKTRAIDSLPFSDEPSSTMGAKMSIRLQKYARPQSSYKTTPKNTSQEAADEQRKKYEIEEKYEKTTTLTQKEGNEIVIDNVSFYGEYKKDDINSVIEALNKSLRAQIDEKFKADKAKAEELKQSAQFVNDDGKIAFVTDGDYAGKISPEKLDLKELKLDNQQKSNPTVNQNTQIQIANNIDYSKPKTKVFFNFDLKLKQYKKDNNGDIDTANIEKIINLDDIKLAKEYTKGNYTDKEIAEFIARDLQTQINGKLLQQNIPNDYVKVVVENNQPVIIVNREYGAKVENKQTINQIQGNIADKTYTPNADPKNNKSQDTQLGINLAGNQAGQDPFINLSFNLKLTQFEKNSQASGDVLISDPDRAGTVPNTGTPGHLNLAKEKQVVDLGDISITKVYSGKNSDGSNRTNEEILRDIAADLQTQINSKLATSKSNIDSTQVRVEVKNGMINLSIDGNLKTEIKNNTQNIAPNTFDNTEKIPTKDTKSNINIPIPALNPNGDTNVYMDLNIDIRHYAKNSKGNPDTNVKLDPIKVDEIHLNKSYPRQKSDGTNYTDLEIKKQIFEDAKKQIEDKLAQLNPPLDKKAINISMVGDNIQISVYPDIEVTISSDTEKPNSITKDVNFIPSQNSDIEPTREVMPFFEMMDRLSRFMEEGDSKGISRMLDIIDSHAKNNQKNQGIGGARTNMYKVMLERTEDIKLNYNKVLSETRDTDYNEMSMKMMIAQYVYRASLSVTAKIIQPSLVDFLR